MIGLITYVSWTVFDGTLCVGKISLSMHSGLLQLLTMLQIFALPSRSPGKYESKLESKQVEQRFHQRDASCEDIASILVGLMSQQEGVPSFCGDACS